MDTNYIAQHITCSKEEKLECKGIVRQLLELQNIARREGILALEEQVIIKQNEYPAMLKIGISLIIDGTDPEIVKMILENYILSSQLDNKAFLESMLIYSGVLGIQQGYNPHWLEEIFYSYFGLDFRTTIFEYCCMIQDIEENGLNKLLEKYRDKINSFEKIAHLDKVVCLLDNRSIQIILREINFFDLRNALLGASEYTYIKFLKNCSIRIQKDFFHELDIIKPLSKESILYSQQKLIDAIKSLLNKGEIILYDTSFSQNLHILSQGEINALLDNKDKTEDHPN